MKLCEGVRIDDRYEIVRVIGESRTGRVYLANDIETSNPVALKLIAPTVLQGQASFAEFDRNSATARTLLHPNIIETYHVGISAADGAIYLVREYVDGETLDALYLMAKRGTPLTPTKAIDVCVPVCLALEYAHNRSILHRYLRPGQILVGTTPGVIKIFGLGIPHLIPPVDLTNCIALADAIDSPMYWSPEQIAGKQLDHRSDIYSLGCVLYEALTGQPPYRGRSAMETAKLHMSSPPRPVNESLPGAVPPRLESAVMRCLEKDPANRFQNAVELRNELLASLA